MTPIDLTSVLKDAPAGEWIALSQNQDCIVGTGKTLNEAITAAERNGVPKPIVTKVPPPHLLIF